MPLFDCSFESAGPYDVGVRLSTLAGAKGESGYLDGSGTAAKFDSPEGCAVSPDGQYVFVAGALRLPRTAHAHAQQCAFVLLSLLRKENNYDTHTKTPLRIVTGCCERS